MANERLGDYHTFPLIQPEDLEVLEVSDDPVDRESVRAYMVFVVTEAIRIKDDKERLEQVTVDLREQNDHDALTGCYTREAFTKQLDELLATFRNNEARRKTDIRSVIMFFMDMWRFHDLNEEYGYQAGDEALMNVVADIQLALRREYDIAGRFGGDEFMVCAPVYGDTDPYEVAEYLQSRINDNVTSRNRNREEGNPEVKITIGYTIVQKDDESEALRAEDVIMRTSEVMHEVKNRLREALGLSGQRE